MAEEKTKKKTTTKAKTEAKPKAKPKTEKRTPAKKPTAKKAPAKKTTTTKKSVEKKPVKKQETKKAPVEKKEERSAKAEAEVKEEETKKEEKKVKKVKIKPQLNSETKDKLQKRKEIKKRTPEFLREEWFRYKRVPRNWRRPDGITSKMRRNLKYRPSKVRVGFRGPRDVRGLHSSGFEEVTIFNAGDLEKINPKTQAARIGSSVGTKKRMDIEKKAEELDIRLLNL